MSLKFKEADQVCPHWFEPLVLPLTFHSLGHADREGLPETGWRLHRQKEDPRQEDPEGEIHWAAAHILNTWRFTGRSHLLLGCQHP